MAKPLLTMYVYGYVACGVYFQSGLISELVDDSKHFGRQLKFNLD